MTTTTQPQPGTLRAICDECGEVRHVTARDGYGKTGDDCGGVRCMVRVKCANCGRLTVHAYLRDFDPDADDCEEQYGEPMTTVHEAAIANGWKPADGSPWVGPDGVTYASKDAFYVAQVVDRAQAAAKAANEASQGVAHRDNCLCSKAEREQPPVMLDERRVSPSLLCDDVLRLLDKKLTEAGAPMVRTYKRRYNAAGEGIGPDMGIRSCDALLFYRVYDRVLTAIARGAERQR